MSQVEASTLYVLHLTQAEYRLVGLGLSRKLRGKDAEDARALNVRLLEQRAQHLREMLGIADGLLASAREEQGDEEDRTVTTAVGNDEPETMTELAARTLRQS